MTHDESRVLVVEIYAERAVEHFRTAHPFLSKILFPESGLSQTTILDDVKTWFAKKNENYPVERAVKKCGEIIGSDLEAKAQRVVPLSRGILVGIFFLAQTIAFGIIARAALVDIRVSAHPLRH